MSIQLNDEIMFCERCGGGIGCNIDTYSRCVCSKMQFAPNEVKYISKSYSGCLCEECLSLLKEEYKATLAV